MLKKRLLVLAVMLCSLAVLASETAEAGAWCSCAATSCTSCEATCSPDPGTSAGEVLAAAQACCVQAMEAMKETGPATACGPGGVGQSISVTSK
jgi:hypothetical protein